MARRVSDARPKAGNRLVMLVAAAVAVGLFVAAGWMALHPVTVIPHPRRVGHPHPGTAGASPHRPNVVIFLIDTLRADRLGAYGYDKPTSPNLDALAAEGVVFEQCSAPAPWTLPSVASLLTSTFPCEHGVLVDGQRIGPSMEPLAVRLSGAGYATASFHANAYASRMSGLDRGYDVSNSVSFVNGRTVEGWLETVGSKPFYLYVHNIEPHNPYNAPDRLVALFGTVSAEAKKAVQNAYLTYRKLTRADFAARLPIGTTDNMAEQDQAMRRLDTLKQHIDILYDAVVRQADHRLGSVIEVLKRRGLWDNTLFIVTADHGEELGDHGGWQHDQSVYEEVIHVPLVVRFPGGRQAGRRVRAVVSLVDVMPTILDVIGVPEAASGCRGTSLAPPLDDTGARPAVTTVRINRKKYYRPYKETRGDVNLVIRRGGFKGIWNVEPQTLELYDLDADPQERSNQVSQYPDLAASMQQFVRAWLENCGRKAQDTPATRPEGLDAETLDNLRSLGYVE